MSQLARPFSIDNTFTASTVLQSIDMKATTSGNDNTFDLNSDLLNEGNSLVGGRMAQINDIEINCMG